MASFRQLLRAMRPRQWTKNGVVFIAVVFAQQLGHLHSDLLGLLAVFLFCMMSGVVYIINDLVDIEKDREHPVKRFRPLPSGALSPTFAMVCALAIGASSAFVAFEYSPKLALALVGYLVLNLAYSFVLKNIVLIDLFGIAGGFLLRAAGGAWVINVDISPWLYLCTLLGSLFLGLGKRRHEIVVLEGAAASHRKILSEYSIEFLEELITMMATALVVSYSLYTYFVFQKTTYAMMATIPFAIYGIFRYLYLIHLKGDGGAPEEILLRDMPLIVDILLWIGSSAIILYFFR